MNVSTTKQAAIKELAYLFEQYEIPTDKPIYYNSSLYSDILDIGNNCEVDVASGLSKICFINLIEGYVVKIPLAGEHRYASRLNRDTNYVDERYHYNYCKLEAETYLNLANSNFSNLFLKTEYAGMLGALEIYIQPCATPLTSVNKEISEQFYEKADSDDYTNYNCFCDDIDVVASFIEYYGEKLTQEIGSFLDYNEIKDIHMGNIGLYNNELVIYDYSGFNR